MTNHPDARDAKTFSYAIQVQPRNGQHLVEFPDGVTLYAVRPWTPRDARTFPQAWTAMRAVSGMALVLDRDRYVYLVPAVEAQQ